jgi:3-hydroxyisobutyrate dehydrogenase-like beta-hydroxyacid dehydrogenase
MSGAGITTVGVIGLGDIGHGVAEAVVRSGLGLIVFDLRHEATAAFTGRAQVASSPTELATASDVIIVAVVDDSQVLSVLEGVEGDSGAVRAARKGSVVLVLSTVSPDTVRAVAESARPRDVDVLDCAVSGGPEAAGEGSLVAMVGGGDHAVGRARPVLDTFCSLVVHMGPLGSGLQAKLARNIVQYGSWLAAYEAQLLAEAAGIDLAKLASVIRASDRKIGGASRLMFRSTVAPFEEHDDERIIGAMSTAAALAHKDLRAALELGAELGVSLPLAEMTEARADALFGIAPDPSDGGARGAATRNATRNATGKG